jgi:hypothetical protein
MRRPSIVKFKKIFLLDSFFGSFKWFGVGFDVKRGISLPYALLEEFS